MSSLAVPSVATRTTARAPSRTGLGRTGLRELGVLLLVYVGYALSRVLADDSLAPAVARAVRILDLERVLFLDVEAGMNRWFLNHETFGLAASFYYAGAHYVLTLVVVVWLYCRHRAAYGPVRLALVGSTGVALLAYLAMPTAPPRLMDGWTDLLAVHSAAGWWGGEASAPQGLGWLTNQLAAFPSMHAGWALWVALAVGYVSGRSWATGLAWAHAIVTAIVVVGTGNHWVLDVVAGWAVVLLAWRTVVPRRMETLAATGAPFARWFAHVCERWSVAQPPPTCASRQDTTAGGAPATIVGAESVAQPPPTRSPQRDTPAEVRQPHSPGVGMWPSHRRPARTGATHARKVHQPHGRAQECG